jgi:hypothetical protein
MTTRIPIFFAIAGIAAAQSAAQISMQSSAGGTNSYSGSATFGPAPMMGYAVTGAPYSGEEVSENVHVLADGTRLTQRMVGRKVWRDSEGRTRSERTLGGGMNPAAMPPIVEITDPVAGFKYTLDTQRKVAHRQALNARGMVAASVGSSATLGGGIYTGPTPQAATTGGGGGGRGGSMGVTMAAPFPGQADPQMRPRFTNEPIGTRSIEGEMAEARGAPSRTRSA